MTHTYIRWHSNAKCRPAFDTSEENGAIYIAPRAGRALVETIIVIIGYLFTPAQLHGVTVRPD